MSKLPEIRINFSWLLFYAESHEIAKANNFQLESYEYYEDKTLKYRIEWRKHEQKIIKALQ